MACVLSFALVAPVPATLNFGVSHVGGNASMNVVRKCAVTGGGTVVPMFGIVECREHPWRMITMAMDRSPGAHIYVGQCI